MHFNASNGTQAGHNVLLFLCRICREVCTGFPVFRQGMKITTIAASNAPWMLSLRTLRWRLAPPFPSPFPPLPRPDMIASLLVLD